jgi:carbonic anhydrase
MKKVFHFNSMRDQYVADAAVVWCFDHRFHTGFAKFLKRIGATEIDVIKIAGGAKALASPATESERAFVLNQIRASIRLHQSRRVILMVHSDCGGYGGLAAFGNDPLREAEHHADELRKAARCVAEAIPEIKIEVYFVNFEGVWEIELGQVTLEATA